MSIHRSVASGLALVMALGIAGCGGSSDTADQPAPAEQVSETTTVPAEEPPTVTALTPEQSELVERAATLAKAIQAAPDEAVSILAEKGLTPEQWSTMLEDIARDPVLSAAYEAAMR